MTHYFTEFFLRLASLKDRYLRKLSADEKLAIKTCPLFSRASEADLEALFKSAFIVRCRANAAIVREGEIGDAIFIILSGSVRVYTVSKDQGKIPLSRLGEGDYFGEQALLGPAHKSRSASVEAIDDTTLLRIPDSTVLRSFLGQAPLKEKKLKDSEVYFSRVSDFYQALEPVLSGIEKKEVLEKSEGETIFNVGDEPTNVYLILSGSIELRLPENGGASFQTTRLTKGHVFGELGVLNGQPRAATAVAAEPALLMVVNGEEFRGQVSKQPDVKSFFQNLATSYKIPKIGSAEQLTGRDADGDPILTTAYYADSGTQILSVYSLAKEHFRMFVKGLQPDKTYSYQDAFSSLHVGIKDSKIVVIESSGKTTGVPRLCRLLLDGESVAASAFDDLESTGVVNFPEEKMGAHQETLCECLSIPASRIKTLIDQGIKSADELSRATGAGTACGGCRHRIKEMLGESIWMSAIMKLSTEHNAHVRSYAIQLINTDFQSCQPGQHLIIQVKIGSHWIERPYTISKIAPDLKQARVTVKMEENGVFTSWLFAQGKSDIEVNVVRPQGHFVFDVKDPRPFLCFAGGIGITPFIMLAETLQERGLDKQVHLVYSASTAEDFIFRAELDRLSAAHPDFRLTYRETRTAGRLTKADVSTLVSEAKDGLVYICGSNAFTAAIRSDLLELGCDPAAIRVEEFANSWGTTH